MKSSGKLYESFLKKIEEKKGEKLVDNTIPFALLYHIINNLTDITINGVSQLETRSEYHVLCHIYQEWKGQSDMFIRLYTESPNTGINYGSISVRDIGSNKNRFEALFSEIDNLEVFESVNFYAIP